ncbi:MAG TPA: hypothetical protein VIR98_01780 [Candidatus Paceibacterota bacterium]|jgi:hypothetical protein
MFEYLDRLRKKPEPDRRKAVLGISVAVTIIIVVVWVFMTTVRIRGMDFSIPKESEEASVPSLSDTFSTFSDRMKSIFSGGVTYDADAVEK